MGCKALLVLVMFMVTILLTATEEAPRDLLQEKFDQNDGNNKVLARAIDKSNQYHGGGGREFDGRGGYRRRRFGGRRGYGGPRRVGDGWRGGYDLGCAHGCCFDTPYGCLICCRGS